MTEIDLDAFESAKAMREQLGDDYPKRGSILDLWFRTADALESTTAHLREAEQAMTELTKDEEVTVEDSIFRWSELPDVLARNMRAVTEAQQEAKRWAVQAKGDRARLREAEKDLDLIAGLAASSIPNAELRHKPFAAVHELAVTLAETERRLREAEACIEDIAAMHVKRERPSLIDCSHGPELVVCRTRERIAAYTTTKTTKTEKEQDQ